MACCEILVMTGRVHDMILDPKLTGQLPEVIAEGAYYGMQTFDQHLLQHLHAGRVTMDDAMRVATSPHDFKLMVARGLRSPATTAPRPRSIDGAAPLRRPRTASRPPPPPVPSAPMTVGLTDPGAAAARPRRRRPRRPRASPTELTVAARAPSVAAHADARSRSSARRSRRTPSRCRTRSCSRCASTR